MPNLLPFSPSPLHLNIANRFRDISTSNRRTQQVFRFNSGISREQRQIQSTNFFGSPQKTVASKISFFWPSPPKRNSTFHVTQKGQRTEFPAFRVFPREKIINLISALPWDSGASLKGIRSNEAMEIYCQFTWRSWRRKKRKRNGYQHKERSNSISWLFISEEPRPDYHNYNARTFWFLMSFFLLDGRNMKNNLIYRHDFRMSEWTLLQKQQDYH